MFKLGLCCLFHEQPIRFPATTATALARLERPRQLERLAGLCQANAEALGQAIDYCADHGIGAFRINSQILPLKTHPQVGYRMEELPGGGAIIEQFRQAGRMAAQKRIRLSMHPDQFVVLNSNTPKVVASSLAELAYQAEFGEWTGVDVINLHGGGIYGDRAAALDRLEQEIERLPAAIRSRLTLENDDRCFTPSDLLPVCRRTGIPLVYDVHHHRCLPDALSVEDATTAAIQTWGGRKPLFHISSPKAGWIAGADPRPHHDFIDPADFPACWRNLDLTIEIEAKAKETAVERLAAQLSREDAKNAK
jgi:UV DNA damage endonuclease